MHIFDSLSQKKVLLKKPRKGTVNFFVCGPTVYDYAHIGHARTYVFFDAFVKYLRSTGIKVFYLQNITDIDDKIITRAKKKKKSPISLAREFEKQYLSDIKKLKINSVSKYARATKFIPQIIKQIAQLVNKGYAYKIENDGYYFDVSAFSDYGKLSKRTNEQAEDAISRIDQSIGKKNKADFALWKFYKEGEPFWNTPFGKGRPGWHIEDTAITETFFGPQYDIHGGGVDLKFPHHEAEIAQQEAASGKKPLVKIWMHTGFLLVNGKKMSKSLGNFITIKEFLKNNSPEVLRLMILQNHYRSPFNYTEQSTEQTRRTLETINEFLQKLEFIVKNCKLKTASRKLNIEKYKKEFENSLNDDFNTPKALSVIFNLISENQKGIWNMSPKIAKEISKFIKTSLKTFEIKPKSAKIPAKISALAKKRELYRTNKQFVQSDALRTQIEMLGCVIEDTPFGPFVRKNS